MKRPTAFVREATGFVREMGPTDALIFAVAAIIGPTWIPVFTSLWYTLPGINIPVTMLLFAFLAVFHGVYYIVITTAMPRTAGPGYVALSRLVFPALGMYSSAILLLTYNISFAINANISVTIGLGSSLATFGALTGNTIARAIGDALQANGGKNMYGFIGGAIFVVAIGLICTTGLRRVIKVNRVMIVLATLGFVLTAGVLLSVTQGDFARLFNGYVGEGAYSNVIENAHSSGWMLPQDFWTPTIMGLPLALYLVLGYHFQSYLGGELKSPTRTMTIGVLGGLGYSAFWYVFLAILFLRATGEDFITSLGFLYFSGSPQYPLPVAPWVTNVVTIINSNIVLNALVILSYLAWGYLLCMMFFMCSSRIIFAWAFDRAAPAKLAEVTDRWRSPVYLNILLFIIAIVLTAVYNFTNLLGVLNVGFFYTMALLPEGLAGIFLAFRRRDILEDAPPLVKRRIAGIPLIGILGVYAVLFVGSILALAVMNPYIMGDITPFGGGGLFNWSAAILVGLAGVAILYGMRAYYRSKGIPIELVYKTIPPE